MFVILSAAKDLLLACDATNVANAS